VTVLGRRRPRFLLHGGGPGPKAGRHSPAPDPNCQWDACPSESAPRPPRAIQDLCMCDSAGVTPTDIERPPSPRPPVDVSASKYPGLRVGYVKRLVRGEGTRVPAEGPRRGCPGGLRGSTSGGYLGEVSSGGPTRAAGPSPLKGRPGAFKLLQPTRVCFQRAGCKGPYSMLPVRPPSTMMRQAKPPALVTQACSGPFPHSELILEPCPETGVD
jgi:hypothetical protein